MENSPRFLTDWETTKTNEISELTGLEPGLGSPCLKKIPSWAIRSVTPLPSSSP